MSDSRSLTHQEEEKQDVIVERSQALPSKTRSPWWLAFGGFLILFNIWGLLISFGAFQEFYTLEYLTNYSASSIAWIGTVQGALLVFVGFFAGPLYDLGFWPHLYAVGSFLTVFGIMMLSLSTQYYQVFLSQGICVGVGSGLLFIPLYSLIGNAFTKQRAMAMGIITSGIAMGGIIYTIVYLRLLPVLGFAWMVRVIGFLNLIVFLIAGPAIIPPQKLGKRSVRKLFDKAALVDPAFMIFTAVQLFAYLGYLVPFFYIPTFAEVVLKADQTTALYILVASQAASLFGRLGAALSVPYVGVIVPWFFCCVISGVLCFAWIAISEQSALIAFAVIYGFFSGSLIALPPSLFPVICPDPTKLGARMGISWISAGVATLLGSPIAGLIVHVETADFFGAQVFSGAMLLFAALLLVILWIVLWRRKGTWRI